MQEDRIYSEGRIDYFTINMKGRVIVKQHEIL